MRDWLTHIKQFWKRIRGFSSPEAVGDYLFTLGRPLSAEDLCLLTSNLEELTNFQESRAFVEWFLGYFYPGDQSHIAFKVYTARMVDTLCQKVLHHCRARRTFIIVIHFDGLPFRFHCAPNSSYHVSHIRPSRHS